MTYLPALSSNPSFYAPIQTPQTSNIAFQPSESITRSLVLNGKSQVVKFTRVGAGVIKISTPQGLPLGEGAASTIEPLLATGEAISVSTLLTTAFVFTAGFLITFFSFSPNIAKEQYLIPKGKVDTVEAFMAATTLAGLNFNRQPELRSALRRRLGNNLKPFILRANQLAQEIKRNGLKPENATAILRAELEVMLMKQGAGANTKVKLPKPPLDRVGAKPDRDKHGGLMPVAPRQKPLQIVPNVAALPIMPAYKPVPVVPEITKVKPQTKPMPIGGVRVAPFNDKIKLERPVKMDGTKVRVKKRKSDDTQTKQPTRADASDEQEATQTQTTAVKSKAESNRISHVKRKFSQKITETVHNNPSWSRKQAYEWLTHNDPEVAAAHLGLSVEHTKLLKSECQNGYENYDSNRIIKLFTEFVEKALDHKYLKKTIDHVISYEADITETYNRAKNSDLVSLEQQLNLSPEEVRMLRDLCRALNLFGVEKRVKIFKKLGFDSKYAQDTIEDIARNDSDMRQTYARAKNVDVEFLVKNLSLSSDQKKILEDIFIEKSLMAKEKNLELFKQFKKRGYDWKYAKDTIMYAFHYNANITNSYNVAKNTDPSLVAENLNLSVEEVEILNALLSNRPLFRKEEIVKFIKEFKVNKLDFKYAVMTILDVIDEHRNFASAYSVNINSRNELTETLIKLDARDQIDIIHFLKRKPALQQSKIINYIKQHPNGENLMSSISVLQMQRNLEKFLKNY